MPNYSSTSRLLFTPKPARGEAFSCDIKAVYSGLTILEISGKGAADLFRHEAGCHRWQRVPPTEKGDRVHSSTISIAVLGTVEVPEFELNLNDVEFETFKASAPGGQHTQKTETAVRATHRPTGISAVSQSRSQHANKAAALKDLEQKLAEQFREEQASKINDARIDQIGAGTRSEKIRTVQEQNGTVSNHLTGRKVDLKVYRKGQIWRIH